MKPYSYAIIYVDTRNGLSGCSTDVFYDAKDQMDLINWYESRHKFIKVVAVVPHEKRPA